MAKVGILTQSNFKTYYEATIIKKMWCWGKNINTDRENRIKPQNTGKQIWSIYLWQKQKQFNWEIIVFTTNQAEAIGFPLHKSVCVAIMEYLILGSNIKKSGFFGSWFFRVYMKHSVGICFWWGPWEACNYGRRQRGTRGSHGEKGDKKREWRKC